MRLIILLSVFTFSCWAAPTWPSDPENLFALPAQRPALANGFSKIIKHAEEQVEKRYKLNRIYRITINLAWKFDENIKHSEKGAAACRSDKSSKPPVQGSDTSATTCKMDRDFKLLDKAFDVSAIKIHFWAWNGETDSQSRTIEWELFQPKLSQTNGNGQSNGESSKGVGGATSIYRNAKKHDFDGASYVQPDVAEQDSPSQTKHGTGEILTDRAMTQKKASELLRTHGLFRAADFDNFFLESALETYHSAILNDPKLPRVYWEQATIYRTTADHVQIYDVGDYLNLALPQFVCQFAMPGKDVPSVFIGSLQGNPIVSKTRASLDLMMGIRVHHGASGDYVGEGDRLAMIRHDGTRAHHGTKARHGAEEQAGTRDRYGANARHGAKDDEAMNDWVMLRPDESFQTYG